LLCSLAVFGVFTAVIAVVPNFALFLVFLIFLLEPFRLPGERFEVGGGVKNRPGG
jgi:hypothetical protein